MSRRPGESGLEHVVVGLGSLGVFVERVRERRMAIIEISEREEHELIDMGCL